MKYYISPDNWHKKLISKNSSGVGYSANSQGRKAMSKLPLADKDARENEQTDRPRFRARARARRWYRRAAGGLGIGDRGTRGSDHRHDGQGCLVEDTVSALDRAPNRQPLHETGAACSPNVFLGHKIAWTPRTEGGSPGSSAPSREYVLGVAASGVARVDAFLASGESAPAHLNGNGGFFYREPADAARAGVGIASLVAYDDAGREIDRMAVQQ
jgi:hypothetical protein